ncbi:hypothetical protein ACFWM5_06985 [Streptomyces bobili]|uniref:hypothetical protein n=1 Tax=Streptomyces bobili TaxID=67280 RepID=UPI0036558E8B
MNIPVAAPSAVSAECTLGRQRGYEGVHAMCRQIKDVPLPHSTGILLVRRCHCACHGRRARNQ